MDKEQMGNVSKSKLIGRGPAIWLAGDPEELKPWMDYGIEGIVTNTVVLNEMVKKYGQLVDLVKRYLDITDKPVVVEIDGDTTEELIDVASVFSDMSSRIIIKIPCGVISLGAFAELNKRGVETYCTTVFSLTQAAAVAQAGATHVLPFCDPLKPIGGDPTKLVRECVSMFKGWEQRPYITAALIRSPETAYAALRDGADGIVIFWTVYKEMMSHPLTDQWNKTFLDEWEEMNESGLLKGIPVRKN